MSDYDPFGGSAQEPTIPLASAYPAGPPAPPPPFPPPQARRRRAADAGLILAVVWLAVSVIVGAYLAISSHVIASHDVHPRPLPASAQAPTGSAVQAQSTLLGQNARIERRVISRIGIGVGFVIISLGVLNLNAELRRRARDAP